MFINWAIRLREKAALCQFVHTGCQVTGCTCNHAHPLDKIQVDHQMVDHMYNQEHRVRFLASTYCDSYETRLECAHKLEEAGNTSEAVHPSDNKPSATEARKESDYQRQENAKKGMKKARCTSCRQLFNGTIKQHDGSEKAVEKCQRCWLKEVTCSKCSKKGHCSAKCTQPSKTNARGAASDTENESESEEAADQTPSSSRLNRTWVKSKPSPMMSFHFRTTPSILKANSKYRKNLRKENNNYRHLSGTVGNRNVLVPGNLEWDNVTGNFREAPVKGQPLIKMNMTVMADQMRTWHSKISREEECCLPWEFPTPGLAG